MIESLRLRQAPAFLAIAIAGVLLAATAISPYAALAIPVLALGAAVFAFPLAFFLVLIAATPLAEIPGNLYPAAHLSSVRDVLLVLLLLALLVRAYGRQRLNLPASPIHLPLVAFGAVVLLYMAIGPNLIQAVLGAKALVLYALLYLLTIYFVRSEKHLRLITGGMAASGVVLAAYGLFSYLVPQSFFPANPESILPSIADGATRLHYSGYTYFLAQFAPLLWLAAMLVFRKPSVRVLVTGASGLAIALVAISGLRAAWIALLITGATYFASRGQRRLSAVVALAASVLVVLLLGTDTLFSRVLVTGDPSNISFVGRIQEIQTVWIPLISQHPWGLGTGTFSSSASSSWQSVFGTMTFQFTQGGVTHNGYMEILGELGVIGFLIYLWLLAAVLVQTLRNGRALTSPLARGLNAVCLGQLLAYCAINFLTPAPILFPVNVYFFAFAGLAAALPHVEAEVTGAGAATRTRRLLAGRGEPIGPGT
jgi:O-antigen ligase